MPRVKPLTVAASRGFSGFCPWRFPVSTGSLIYTRSDGTYSNICGAGGEYRNRTDLNILLARQASTPCRPIPHIQTAVFIEVPVNDLSLNQCSSLGLALQRVAPRNSPLFTLRQDATFSLTRYPQETFRRYCEAELFTRIARWSPHRASIPAFHLERVVS